MQFTTLLLSALSLSLASADMIHLPRASKAATAAAASNTKAAGNNGNNGNGKAATGGATAGGATAGGAGGDFGSCTPTMDFQTGRAEFNRDANTGTFFPTDATLVGNSGQSDALNPNIITNFICDQLTNVCGADDAAKAACQSAQDAVAALGTKDQSTADAFNQALGF